MAAPGRPRLHREHSGMLPHHQFKAALAESASASPRRKKPAKKQQPPMLGQLKRQPSLFSSSSQLLASAVHEVQPLTSIKNQLADERARRRRHFAASQQPVIFDRFAARAGSPGKESMASEQIPGVSASRAWLEDDAGSAGSGDPEAAEAAAVAKIKKAAIFFDRSYASSRESFRAFEAPNLDSAQLAEMVRHASNVRLTRAETAALAARYPGEGAGEIDGPAFVRFFFRCGFEARTEERTRRWEAAAENDRERERSHQRVLDRDEAERRRTVTAPYTARDEENAWTKLAKVAKNKGLQGDLVSRAAFESLMTPAEIKLQLKKSYNIDMTHAEMGAICGRFDKNASGQINGAEFQYEWSHVLDGNRSKNFFGQLKEGERRSSLLAPPKLDALEAEAGPEEGGGFIDDGTARRGSVTRLSFGMAKIGAKTSDPGKVLRRRTSVSREQNALLLAQLRAPPATAPAAPAPERKRHTSRPATSDAVPFAQRRPSSLVIPTAVAPRPLTRERSYSGRAATAPQAAKAPLHKFAAKPELPGQIARAAPKPRAAPLDVVRFAPEPEPRRAEDYGGDFRAMLLDAGREKRGADALGARPATTGSPTRPATSGRADPGGGL